MVEHVINGSSTDNQRKTISEFAAEDYGPIFFEDIDERAGIILVLYGKSKRILGATVHIEDLYGHMLKEKKFPPLFRNLISYDVPALITSTEVLGNIVIRDRHAGHMGGKYALVASQREALYHALALGDSGENLLAVNGPPGTGKTTLIQSIVASLWVIAAVKGEEPPLIFGTSANNRAVKNIIECFGKAELPKEEAEELTLLAGRWLPGLKSYGAYCSRGQKKVHSNKELNEDNYQLIFRSKDAHIGFFDGILRDELYPNLEAEYIEKANKYLVRTDEKNNEDPSRPSRVDCQGKIKEIVIMLHSEIKSIYENQKKIFDLTYLINELDQRMAHIIAVSGQENPRDIKGRTCFRHKQDGRIMHGHRRDEEKVF